LCGASCSSSVECTHEEADDGEGSDGREPEEDPEESGENRAQSETNHRQSEADSGEAEEAISPRNTLRFGESGVGTLDAHADAVNPKAEELKARLRIGLGPTANSRHVLASFSKRPTKPNCGWMYSTRASCLESLFRLCCSRKVVRYAGSSWLRT
jgi:hypothetical protein